MTLRESDRDEVLEQHILDELREMDSQRRAVSSAGQTPTALPSPASTPMRPARVTVFAVQGAPENAEAYLLSQFKAESFKAAKGVVHLQFPGDDPQQRRQDPRPARYWPTEIYWGNGR